MRIENTKTVITLALTAALAACGGGGGGGGDSGTAGGGTPPVTNAAPTISGAPLDIINVGDSYSFTPTASDPDGDTLTFSISNMPAWAVFDSASGELSGDPTAGNIGAFEDVEIRVSDGRLSASLAPFSIVVMPEVLGRDNFTPKGDVFPVDGGYQSVGNLELSSGQLTQEFPNGDLVLTFDGEDQLDVMYGETDMPVNASANSQVIGSVRAVVETMTGSQINEDTDFDIRLIEDRKYFVFYIGAAFDLLMTDRNSPTEQETVEISTPYGGQIIMITDPADSFMYRYGSTPIVGAYGYGESDNGLIPFDPELPFGELDSFTGHRLEKGTMGIGFKYVDLFEISGTRVIKDPQFADINWDDVFESDIEYRAGMNGDLNFALSVVGFGLFSFDLAETSATFDIGFDRQQAALSLRIAPDEALFPNVYNLGPSGEVTGSAYLNGDAEYGFFLDGTWRNSLPEAEIGGLVSIENGTVGLTGTVDADDESLSVSLTLASNETIGRVEFPASYAENINSNVSQALDRRIAEVEQTVADLEAAVADYEFEVSLRGLRSALPALMDEAVRTLNGIPDSARTQAEGGALSYMRSRCIDLVLGKVCLDDIVDEKAIAERAGDRAYNDASSAIVAPKAAMLELKKRALEADDESLRAALEAGLNAAYDNRTVRVQTSYAHTFGEPFNKRYTVYSRDDTERVLSTSDANRIKQAADNVYRIQETSDIVVNTNEILDRLPTTDVINNVKSEVEAGTASVPSIDGLGYRASGNSYDAFVTVDGEDQVIEINVLSPSDVREGVSDLLAGLLLDAVNN